MDEKEGEGLASTLALAMQVPTLEMIASAFDTPRTDTLQARREALGNGSEEERSQWTDDEA